MRRRLITVLIFAVTGALAASTLVYRVMVARASAPRASGPLVAVAARDLAVGLWSRIRMFASRNGTAPWTRSGSCAARTWWAAV